MPRARFLRPEFFEDEKVARLSLGARLLFERVWLDSDIRGVFDWSPKLGKLHAFPHDPFTLEQIQEWFDEILALRMIEAFESDSKKWFCVVHFSRHQTFTTSEHKYFAEQKRKGVANPDPPNGYNISQTQVRLKSDSKSQTQVVTESDNHNGSCSGSSALPALEAGERDSGKRKSPARPGCARPALGAGGAPAHGANWEIDENGIIHTKGKT